MNHAVKSIVAILLLVSVSAAEGPPAGEAKMSPRWRATRHAVQLAAQQASFRWAMPATISRRVFVGEAGDKPVPATKLLAEVARQAGLTVETLNGIQVLHVPDQARRKELAGAAIGGDERARLAAICQFGWLQDAHALPELAKLAVGADAAAALAAAQAIRRLDGEEELDWRLFGVSTADPEFYGMASPVPPWQTPLSLAFPGCASEADLAKLAESRYIPLREAAARLAPSLGDKGKPLAERLAADPGPIVRAAAKRSLKAWDDPAKTPLPPPRRFDGKPWWQDSPDLAAASGQIRGAKDHDTVWRTTGRKVGYLGTPEAISVLLDVGGGNTPWHEMAAIPLAEFCGGDNVAAYLKTRADVGDGWALWGLTNLQDGRQLAESLQTILQTGKPQWMAPPEFPAARWAGVHAVKSLAGRVDTRGHWACLALGHVGGPESADVLLANLANKDPGVAVSAAKGLGETAALAAVKPLIAQLQNPDRLRRHWAALGLGRIGGPDAADALATLLAVERDRKDRLVRKAAAEILKEIGQPSQAARDLIAEFEAEDGMLLPEYRPRNKRFDESFPENTGVRVPELKAKTYCSIGETRVVMDWANRLMIRYGGCTGCYSNECFALDVGSGTWFPVRAACHFINWSNELRTNAGCSRGMAYDGLNKLVWIGKGIGMGPNPGVFNRGRDIGLSAYDAALDRFILPANGTELPKAYSGEPHKFHAFDYAAGLLVGSASGDKGVGVLHADSLMTELRKGPTSMPSMDHYGPPAMAWDPVSGMILCTHPAIDWRLMLYDARANSFKWSAARLPGPVTPRSRGLVYDCLNRTMILAGGTDDRKNVAPICTYDRKADQWADAQAKDLANFDGGYLTAYDPEHNVVLNLSGSAYRYKSVPVGTKGYFGGPTSRPE